MALTSALFFLFIPLTILLYYLLPAKTQWVVLLCASYVFYLSGSGTATVWLILVTFITYITALLLGKENKKRKNLHTEDKKKASKTIKHRKRALVLLEIIGCFGLLYIMKYWNFTANILSPLTENLFGKHIQSIDFLMPLGLSFFIFQSVGYVIDVYRDKYEPEKNPLKLALFVSFFPQIIQGPISRFDNLGHQLYQSRRLDYSNLKYGIQLAMWGYFKKIIIADRAAVFVNAVFADTSAYGGAIIASSIFFYCIQLYCDFSGGIDITRGVAKMFGIDLVENFRRPLFATSLVDYWRRWHITLGAWMRDYVFYSISLSKPFSKMGKWTRKHIGGTLGKILPISLATFIVYFIIGIWHGANFRYVFYGFWNGAIITSSILLSPFYTKVKKQLQINEKGIPWRIFQIARTSFIVFLGRYITRSPRLLTAFSLLLTTFTHPNLQQLWDGTLFQMGLLPTDIIIVLLGMAVVVAIEFFQEQGVKIRKTLEEKGPFLQWLAIFVPLLILLMFGVMREGYISSEFIYKQF